MSNSPFSHDRLITAAGLFALAYAGFGSIAFASPQTGTPSSAPGAAPYLTACSGLHADTPAGAPATPCGQAASAANFASDVTYTYQTFDYPNASKTILWGINDFNELSGQYTVGNGTPHAMVYRHGRFEPLEPDTLGTYFSAGGGPNDFGTTYGAYADASGLQHGFLIQGGHFSTIDFSGHLNSNVDQVNLSGTMAGVFWDADGAFHGVLRQGHDHDTPIDVAGARETYPLGINDRDEIVGYWDTDPNQTHGFYRNADGQFAMIDVPSASATAAFEINDEGQIVGYYIDAAGDIHGFIQVRGKFQYLNVPGAAATVATAINNLGVIAGEYFDDAGGRHGFVATPHEITH